MLKMRLLQLPAASMLLYFSLGQPLLSSHLGLLSEVYKKQETCPVISIDCPDGKSLGDQQIVFKATVPDMVREKITYRWKVSRGEIKEGQGTTSITVEAEKGLGSLTATLEVGGLPEDCHDTASCTMSHY